MGARKYDWKEVQAFHDVGHSFVECQARFGFTHTAWVKAIRRGELVARFRADGGERNSTSADRRRIYDWSAIQAYYDEGNSYYDCMAKFGFSPRSWFKARQRGEIRTRPLGMPIEQLLKQSRSRHAVKARLLNAGLLRNECSACCLTEWLGRPINMHIDHINGVRDDHRLENLRMLCPNCHSQTPTYGGRNMRRRRRLRPVA